MVDLDKTSIFGNDGNDFALSLQWMNRPEADIHELYRLLVNPQLKGMRVYMHVCMCVCVCVCVCVYELQHVCTYVCVYVWISHCLFNG